MQSGFDEAGNEVLVCFVFFPPPRDLDVLGMGHYNSMTKGGIVYHSIHKHRNHFVLH